MRETGKRKMSSVKKANPVKVHRRVLRLLVKVGAVVLLIFSSCTFMSNLVPGFAAEQNPPAETMNWARTTIYILFFIVVIFIGYMVYMQRQFVQACREDKQLTTFVRSQAGLPDGTIRSVLTLIIVVFALYLLTLSAFGVTASFPEGAAAILTTIIGFYFGSRTAARGEDQAQVEQVKQLQTARDQAIAAKDEGQASAIVTKVRKGIEMTKIAAQLLPEPMRKKFDDTVGKLEQGITLVQNLTKAGNATEAVTKAGEVLNLFKAENPVRDGVQKAVASFGTVLGGAVPPLALISTIVGISINLVGAAYEKWRARILGAPFSPAVIPLKVVDANTGFTLFFKSPTLKNAFAKELEGNDRPFVTATVQDLLSEKDMEALWQKFKERFESREQFEAGVEEFRRAVADLELKQDIDPQLVAEVGGFEQLVSHLERIQANPEAEADLHALFTIAEGLQEKGQPVKSIFDKVREEVSS